MTTHEKITRLMSALAGKTSDPWGVVQGIQLRIGVTALSKVQQAFEEKSRGGKGGDGLVWKPLDPKTIAHRREGPGDKPKGLGSKRGWLTKTNDDLWKMIFATRKNWLMVKFGMSEAEAANRAAANRAAAIAWATLKKKGVKTKLEILGTRKVDILRDTGELFRSFSPGVNGKPSGAEGQVFRVEPGAVVVGTNKKPWHHKTRPFWPERLPDDWTDDILESCRKGVFEALQRIT